MEKRTIVMIVGAVALVGAVAWGGVAQYTVAQRDTKVAHLGSSLSSTRKTLVSTKSSLATTESQLAATKKTLATYEPAGALTKAQAAHDFAQAMCFANKSVYSMDALPSTAAYSAYVPVWSADRDNKAKALKILTGDTWPTQVGNAKISADVSTMVTLETMDFNQDLNDIQAGSFANISPEAAYPAGSQGVGTSIRLALGLNPDYNYDCKE